MDKAQVYDLLIEIKENYPNFDISPENVERHFKHLHDFPFEAAMQNVDEHIKTGKYYPNIAEIRGRLGEQIERERMKESTAEHFANLDSWSAASEPPPPGYWEKVKRMIQGEADA